MIRKIFGVLLLAATAFAFGACDKENNETPTPKPAPEAHSGEEAEPVRAELILAGGHFHGVAFHQDADAKGITYKKAVQHLTFVRKGDAWELEKGSAEAFRVLSSRQYLYPYGLWIKYYDAKGQDITATIAANGESRSHQHFFVPSEVKPTFDGKAENDDQIADSLLNYVYMDTNPTDGILKSTTDKATGKTIPAAKLTGSKVIGQNALGDIFEPLNPIGMKGFFQFKKPRKSFVLTVTLLHFDGDAKFPGGKPSPFFAPTAGQLATAHREVVLRVPFVVYASREETGDWETLDAVPYAKLRPTEQHLVLSTARAYGISEELATTEWFAHILGEVDKESGALWF